MTDAGSGAHGDAGAASATQTPAGGVQEWPLELEKRRAYRVAFPLGLRPRLRLADGVFEVIDCSETGLRYRTAGRLPAVGSAIAGELRFPSGVIVQLAGVVVRVQDLDAGVHFASPLGFNVILDAQRFLRAKGVLGPAR